MLWLVYDITWSGLREDKEKEKNRSGLVFVLGIL